ncbi:hypothetical protein RND81_05G039800 [Saponaria officinalis]|uniref:Reverse transcriptase zinc-binding domain-containing protein n=1 Tax=Saponaria officinalis TaxID=3572 RepID=A0AAW1KXC5_SAPOF
MAHLPDNDIKVMLNDEGFEPISIVVQWFLRGLREVENGHSNLRGGSLHMQKLQITRPKLCVTTVLAVQNKLSTIDNICARGIVMVNRCVLCKSALESVRHLFFGCDYSSYVWHHLLVWLGFNRRAWALSRELEWVLKKVRQRHWRSQWLQVAFASAIHYIWLERNHRIFLDREMEGASLISRLKFHIIVRVLYRAKGVENEILDALNGF